MSVFTDLIVGNFPRKIYAQKKTDKDGKKVSEKHASSFLELAIQGMQF